MSAAPRLAVLQELVALLVLSLLPCPRKTPFLLGRLQAWEVLAGDAPALSRPGPPVWLPLVLPNNINWQLQLLALHRRHVRSWHGDLLLHQTWLGAALSFTYSIKKYILSYPRSPCILSYRRSPCIDPKN